MTKKLEELNLTEEQLADVKKLIQGEGDRVRTEYSTKIKDLEKYKPKEKSADEIALEERIKALEEREQAVQKTEKMNDISKKLSEQGLPSQLSKYLIGAEDIEIEITELVDIFKESKLNNSFKPTGGAKETKTISKEDFSKMGYAERAALKESNIDLYNSLAE